MHSTSTAVAWPRPASYVLVALAALVAAAAVALAVPQGARAHATAGVPYHALALDEFSKSGCLYYFPRPKQVYGFKNETIYWRPIAATWNGYNWEYVYDAWDSSLTTPTGLTPPWFSTDGWGNPTVVYGHTLGYSLVIRPGRLYWIGQEIHYGSNGHRHTQWLGTDSC